MPPIPPSRPEILSRVKTIMRRDLKLGPDLDIADDMPFFGGEADIDSLDVLLLLGSVEKEFGVKVPNEAVGRQVFASVATLVDFLEEQLAGPGAARPAAAAAVSPDEYLPRLPHGEPFRFVTRVVAVAPGESAEAVWAVAGSEPFFAGHFPGRPIVPGVLLAEALAQASGFAIPTPAAGPAEGRLAQVDVRFERPVAPPAEITLRSKLVRSAGTLHLFDVTASVGGSVVARGSLTLSSGVADLSSPS